MSEIEVGMHKPKCCAFEVVRPSGHTMEVPPAAPMSRRIDGVVFRLQSQDTLATSTGNVISDIS